ncbi:cellulase family glycosylhydrolase [uncultured Winogradskyella sp.]|uniref:cellulase family glycosylhydrolase n=1 Tax=uncultured Winogradskyella sp. TaxID=395353 RepID=UPI002632C733|nr:cellulase family glycosylhydrolase [uncultured Winogradskyella sp.]
MRFRIVFVLFLLSFFLSCNTKEDSVISNTTYSIVDSKITFNSNAKQFVGANALHSFGTGSEDMPLWNLNIAREFVGNVNENPIEGTPVQDANGQFLHSLQAIVDDNRANNLVTILCPFGWDGQASNLLTGKFPAETAFWEAYKVKLALWAEHFKEQSDVWIEVWNEPYRFDRMDGYTDQNWLSTMTELYTIIRNTGNTNIVLIPCAEQGQDESVLINIGNLFLDTTDNVLFDIHAYEKWLLEPTAEIENRIQNLVDLNLPLFFGEVAPVNSGVLMNPEVFLDIIHNNQLSYAAWLWKYDETDQDALLTSDGSPNNFNNNNWGTLFRFFAFKDRL